jgi:hypothetical protein
MPFERNHDRFHVERHLFRTITSDSACTGISDPERGMA